MASVTLWNASALEVVSLKATKELPNSCQLLTPKLLKDDRPKQMLTIKDDNIRRLIQVGQKMAAKELKPILLRLTGRRGRPEERIVMPSPKAKLLLRRHSKVRAENFGRKSTKAIKRQPTIEKQENTSADNLLMQALVKIQHNVQSFEKAFEAKLKNQEDRFRTLFDPVASNVTTLKEELREIIRLRNKVIQLTDRVNKLSPITKHLRDDWRKKNDLPPDSSSFPAL
jgi:hypothetical protein